MNLFAFRLPGEEKISKYQSEQLIKSRALPDEKGFIFVPFVFPGFFYFIPSDNKIDVIPQDVIEQNAVNLQIEQETTEEEYSRYIKHIQATINGDKDKKTVASRRKIIPVEKTAETLFTELCNNYPHAYVFCISTPETGTWMGASPELLLSRQENTFKTVSLAGTKSIEMLKAWDTKNIFEQRIVTDFICDIFKNAGLEVYKSQNYTVSAGPVEHICTDIEGKGIIESVNNLITQLYPTPALCGYPRAEALKTIEENETKGRGLYGGFSGPIASAEDFRFYVTLRCMQLFKNIALLYAGGGITMYSKADEEWRETEKKLSTLSAFL